VRATAATGGLKLPGEPVKEDPHRICTPVSDRRHRYAVATRSAPVGGHVQPRPPHHRLADKSFRPAAT
jgi:hypothetical protein